LVFEVFFEPICFHERIGMRVLSRSCSHRKETSGVAHDWARNFKNSIAEEALRTTTVQPRNPFQLVRATRLTLLRLQQLDGVAQLSCPLVKLFCNRSFHLASHDLKLREWTLRFHFLKPFVKKCDFGAFRYQLRKVRLL